MKGAMRERQVEISEKGDRERDKEKEPMASPTLGVGLVYCLVKAHP